MLFGIDSLHGQEEELCDKCKTLYYAEQLESVDNSLPPSQLQQYHHLPSASVHSDGDFPFEPEVPHYHFVHGGNSTGNDHVPTPPSFLESGQNGIHIAAGQPPHKAFLTHACKWRDSRGLCDKHVNEEKVTDHMTSHLPTPSPDLMVECQWDGCKLENYIRRDTILRHIRQVHLKIRPRRLS